MYDEIYQNLCNAGEPLWRDENGEVVEEHKAHGLASHCELIHLDWLLFIDECGSNTLQTKDGQVGGQRFLCSIDGRPQQCATTKDAHFMVLGFMAASGEAVMCGVIFAAKSFQHEWRTGFDPFAEWVGEEEDIALNCGYDKLYPFGPSCLFKGKNCTLLLLLLRKWKY
jgi:hypothetical protein